jgi:hypothetical protein
MTWRTKRRHAFSTIVHALTPSSASGNHRPLALDRTQTGHASRLGSVDAPQHAGVALDISTAASQSDACSGRDPSAIIGPRTGLMAGVQLMIIMARQLGNSKQKV